MKKLVLLFIGILISFILIAQEQSAYYSTVNSSPHILLSENAESYIRQAAIQSHLNFIQFHSQKRNIKKEQKLCKQLKIEFLNYRKVFPERSEFTMPSNTKKQPDTISGFFVKAYYTDSFYPFRYRPPSLPDSLKNKVTIVHSGTSGRMFSGRPAPKLFPEHPSVVYRDSSGQHYHIRSEKYFTPLVLSLQANQYILLEVFDTVYHYQGIIAVNINDYKDLMFVAGDFYSLGFPSIDKALILQLSQKPKFKPREKYFSRIQHKGWQRLRHYYANIPEYNVQLPKNYDFINYDGMLEIARMIGYSFMPPGFRAFLTDYENEYFTFELTRGSWGKVPDLEELCLSYYTGKPYRSHLAFVAPRGTRLFKNRNALCYDFDNSLIWRMHIRINPETGNIQLKIVEMLDISKMPWCPK